MTEGIELAIALLAIAVFSVALVLHYHLKRFWHLANDEWHVNIKVKAALGWTDGNSLRIWHEPWKLDE